MNIFGWQFAAALGGVIALAACSTPAPPPTQVAATLQAAAGVNPSASKRPSPLLLRVYELKSATAFNSADFMSLYQRDQAELATDLIAKDDFLLAPSETRTFNKTLAPETRFLGVLAAYRDLEHATWRAVVPVRPGKKHAVVIKAHQLAVEATVSP